jgi:transposase
VIDRFHLAKLYRKCVDNVRKEEMRSVKKKLPEKEYAKLKGLMWALRKSELSDKEKLILKMAFEHSPKLKEVYEFSHQLTEILNCETTRNGGIRRLKNWISKVEKSDITSFKTFIGTLSKWMEEIANYFVQRESSGFVEGFNNRIKVLKRRCYGIVDRVHLFRRISLDIGVHQTSPIQIDAL